MSSETVSSKPLQGRHVLAMLLTFFFSVVAVDGLMISRALSTFSGEVPGAYKRGLVYNKSIAEEAAQNKLGWTVASAFDPSSGAFRVSVADKNGRGVDGLVVAAVLGRPATNSFDIPLTLKPGDSGDYGANLGPLSNGQWTVAVTVSKSDEIVFRSGTRLWKQP